MATNCSACNDLRENAADFLVNGVTDTACTSLKNDTGFNPSSDTTDCDDLNDANDCLIGNMTDEIEAYDICDWKTFMKKYIPNTYNVIKSIICAVCGLWSNVHSIWNSVKKLECQMNFAFKGVSKTYTRDDFIAGLGVSLESDATVTAAPTLRIRGNTVHAQGSLTIKTTGTVSGTNMAHYWGRLGLRQIDGGDNPRMDITGTNATPDTAGVINTADGNYRLAILPIKKSDIPTVGRIRTGVGMFNNAGCGLVTLTCRDEGEVYPGYWGYDTAGGGTVPSGYYYVVIAVSNVITWGITSKSGEAKITFDVFTQCEINPNEIEC